jgi:hypothetical protein
LSQTNENATVPVLQKFFGTKQGPIRRGAKFSRFMTKIFARVRCIESNSTSRQPFGRLHRYIAKPNIHAYQLPYRARTYPLSLPSRPHIVIDVDSPPNPGGTTALIAATIPKLPFPLRSISTTSYRRHPAAITPPLRRRRSRLPTPPPPARQ